MSGTATLSVRWSPHSTADSQRFVRINSGQQRVNSITYFDAPTSKKEFAPRQLSQHAKLPEIHSFDWSPADEDLVSVGLASGQALLLRLSNPGAPPTALSVKPERPCNSVSFNSTGTLLATGLDRARNGFCLNIWDINRVGGASNHDGPSRQLINEAITSVKFTKENPMSLITGVLSRYIRMFDLRESPSNPSLSVATRCIWGVALDPDPNYFASHSDDGVVCVWDRRFARINPAGEATLNFPRMLENYRDGGQIVGLRYSGRTGTFAALNAAGRLRAYETAKIADQDILPGSSMGFSESIIEVQKSRSSSGWRDSAASLLETGRAYGGTSTSGTRTPSNRGLEMGETLLVNRIKDLARPGRSLEHDRAVSGFDWMDEGRGKGDDGGLRVLVVRNDESLDILSCFGPVPSIAWGSRNQFSITSERDLKIMPTPDPKLVEEPQRQRRKSVSEADDYEDVSGYHYDSPDQKLGLLEKRRRDRSNSIVRPEDFLPEPAEVLKNDICVTMQRRVEAGYMMDCAHNAKLARGEPNNQPLEDMWVWLDGAQECVKDRSMVHGLLDLNFLGVSSIWHGGEGSTPNTRLITSRKPRKEDWTYTCTEINRAAGRKPFVSCPTEYPEQRRLCLAICGWDYEPDSLERTLQSLESESQHAKAAGWALFHGNVDRCIQCLQSGGQQLKVVSTAVAGFFASPQASVSTWRTLATEMATELYDPYLRAIFAYVANAEWKDVLDEIGLPIRERIGIALRWLSDDQLAHFIDQATHTAIRSGDLDGLMLTGVTEAAVDLLQMYIDRTADVQTASLVVAFASPRYFKDDRIQYWIDSYRDLLNSWRLFHARAKFDVARGHASRNRQGQMTMDAPARQVYVRCANCDRSISGNTVKKPAATAGRVGGGGGAPNALVAPKTTVCPHCKKSLPRCAVCLLNLGTIRYGKGEKALDIEKEYDRWFNFCLSCNHGMHAGHAKEWFERHRICPVPECECACRM